MRRICAVSVAAAAAAVLFGVYCGGLPPPKNGPFGDVCVISADCKPTTDGYPPPPIYQCLPIANATGGCQKICTIACDPDAGSSSQCPSTATDQFVTGTCVSASGCGPAVCFPN